MHAYIIKTVGGRKAEGDRSESGESTGSNAGDAQYHSLNLVNCDTSQFYFHCNIFCT